MKENLQKSTEVSNYLMSVQQNFERLRGDLSPQAVLRWVDEIARLKALVADGQEKF